MADSDSNNETRGIIPVLAMHALTKDTLRDLARKFEGVKTLLLNFSPFDGSSEELDRSFEIKLQNSLRSLDEVMKDVEDPAQARVVALLTKHKILDDINQLLVRIGQTIDESLGSRIEDIRLAENDVVHCLRDELITLEEGKSTAESRANNLQAALTSTEVRCQALIDSVDRLNREANEQNRIITELHVEIEEVKATLSAPRRKDRTRKSAAGVRTVIAVKNGDRIADKPGVMNTTVADTIVLGEPNNHGSSARQSKGPAGLTAAMLLSHNMSQRKQRRQESGAEDAGEDEDLNTMVSESAPQTPRSRGSRSRSPSGHSRAPSAVGTLASLAGGTSERESTRTGRTEQRYNGPPASVLRADSSLGWLKHFRAEVQERQDTHITNRKVLTFLNCLSTIKHIYAEKRKFEMKVANVKSLGVARKSVTFDLAQSTKVQNGGAADELKYPPQETLERFVYRMLDKRFGYRKLAVDHAAILRASLHEYSPRNHPVAVFRAVFGGEVDETFPAVIKALKSSIENLVMAKLQKDAPHQRHEVYKRLLDDKISNMTRLPQDEWEAIVEYLYGEQDAIDLSRRILESSVQTDVDAGLLNKVQARERLRPPTTKLLEPEHRGKLGYEPRAQPPGRLKFPPRHAVEYDTLVNLCCMFQLEKRIRLTHDVRCFFDFFDKDSDGILDRREFEGFVRELYKRVAAYNDLAAVAAKDKKERAAAVTGFRQTGSLTKYGRRNASSSTMVDGSELVLETVFGFTETDDDRKAEEAQALIDGPELTALIAAKVEEADPFHVSRITFTTCVKVYVDFVPDAWTSKGREVLSGAKHDG